VSQRTKSSNKKCEKQYSTVLLTKQFILTSPSLLSRFHKGQLDVALQVVKDVVRENKRLRHRDEALEHAKRIPVIFMIAVETADHQLEELQAQQSSQSSEGSYSIVDAPTGSPEAPLTGLPETPPTDHSITPSPDPPETAALDSFVLE